MRAFALKPASILEIVDDRGRLPNSSERRLPDIANGNRQNDARKDRPIGADAPLSAPGLATDEAGHVAQAVIDQNLLRQVAYDLQSAAIIVDELFAVLDDIAPLGVEKVYFHRSSTGRNKAGKIETVEYRYWGGFERLARDPRISAD